MRNYLDRGCTGCLVAGSFNRKFACVGHTPVCLYQPHTAGLLVSDTRPRPTATPSNLEGELNLAGVQRVSSSTPKLGPSERSEPNRKIGREPRSARGDGKAQVTASAVVRGAEGIATRPNISAGGVCPLQRQK